MSGRQHAQGTIPLRNTFCSTLIGRTAVRSASIWGGFEVGPCTLRAILMGFFCWGARVFACAVALPVRFVHSAAYWKSCKKHLCRLLSTKDCSLYHSTATTLALPLLRRKPDVPCATAPGRSRANPSCGVGRVQAS